MVSEEEDNPEDPCTELPNTNMAEIHEDRFEDRNNKDDLVATKSLPCLKMEGSQE